MKINFYFRKKYPTAFSIENLFHTLIDELDRSYTKAGFANERIELPDYNNSPLDIVRNLRFAFRREGAVNHITGDVYSIILGFKNPTVLTIHDCNPLLRYSKWHYRYWVYRFLMYEIPMRLAKSVTVISEKSKTELLELTNCPANKIKVIPNFVDPLFTAKEKVFNEDKPVILQVGTRDNKNLQTLIPALEGIKCHLRIIGAPSESQLALLKQYQINYSWVDKLSFEQVVEEYHTADFLAFISTYEGFGLPIIEAQAVGRVVLTSDISPLKEVAGIGSCLVDPTDQMEVKKRIIKIINDKEYRQTLIAAGFENVKKYTLTNIARQYHLLHTQIARKDVKLTHQSAKVGTRSL